MTPYGYALRIDGLGVAAMPRPRGSGARASQPSPTTPTPTRGSGHPRRTEAGRAPSPALPADPHRSRSTPRPPRPVRLGPPYRCRAEHLPLEGMAVHLAAQGSQGRTPGPRRDNQAMLVGDEGETLRGLMPQDAAWSVVEHAERPTGDPARVVRRIEWDAAWPALLGPTSLAVLGIGVLGTAGATGSAGGLRRIAGSPGAGGLSAGLPVRTGSRRGLRATASG